MDKFVVKKSRRDIIDEEVPSPSEEKCQATPGPSSAGRPSSSIEGVNSLVKKDTPINSESFTSTVSTHYDDPSTEITIDRLEKTARIRRGPFQPQIKNFPVKTIGSGKSARKRSFNSSWYNDYKWIEYSIEKDAAFCFPCRYFAMNHSLSGTIKDAFISTGFSAWNRASEVFKKHEGSKCHISSVVGWKSFIQSKDVDLQLNEAREVELKEKEKQRLKNREYMERLIDIIKTLSKGGRPLRGHDEFEGSSERGLFLECVSLLEKYDTFFKSYIEHAPANCTYLSNRIQNDILQSLTNVMIRNIADSARGQPLSIIADETSDLTNHEQLSFVLRFIPRNEVTPVERFVTLERLMKTDAESIFNTLKQIVERMEISWENVVSVCFDGASTMAGHMTGVQARCKELNESILFVHCYAHCLNLALVNSCTLRNENPTICDFFGALQLVYSFIEGSPKRHCVFEDICKKTDQKLHTLKSLSDTRWACRSEAVTVVRTQYESIVQAIESILDDGTTPPKTRAKAIGILHQIKSFNFIVCLEIMHTILQIVLITSKTLQNPDVDLCQAIETVENLAVALVELRNDESKFEEMYADARESCEKMGIEIPQPKRRKVSTKTGDENPESAFYVESKKDEIRLFTFYPVLDRMITGINERFSQETKEVINIVGKVIKLNLGHEKCSKSDFDTVSKQFGLDSSELQAEFMLLKSKKDLNYPPKKVLKWLDWLNKNQRFQTFKSFKELLEKFSSIPISSCTCERSFSKMSIVKTKLRSTMKQDRLQNLMLPFVEQQLAVDIKSEDIIEEFKRIVPFSRRMTL